MSATSDPAGLAPAATGQGQAYDGVARSFHWAIAALVAVQYLTKWIPKSWAGEDALNAWHLAVGPTILALTLLRLAWRVAHRPPPAPRDLPASLRWLSRATHWTFYGVLIALPVLGWAAASGFGATPYLLGVIPLPALVAKDKAVAETLGGIHGALATVLLAVIALHVAGALYHALVKRDGVIQRMLPLGGAGAS